MIGKHPQDLAVSERQTLLRICGAVAALARQASLAEGGRRRAASPPRLGGIVARMGDRTLRSGLAWRW